MDRKKSAMVRINDIFDELSDENRRLLNELLFAEKLINALTELKTYIDIISFKLKPILVLTELQNYEELYQKVGKLIEDKERQRVVRDLKNSSANDVPKYKTKISSKCKTNVWTRKKRINNKVIKSNSNVNSIDNDNSEDKDRVHQRKSPNKSVDSKKLAISVTETKSFVCEYPGCEYRCDNQMRFSEHTNRHTGDCPYKCSHCDKGFGTKAGLSRHTAAEHKPSNELLVCGFDGCEEQFPSEFKLKYHKYKAHRNAKKHVCDYPGCGYRTAKRKELADHLSRHSGEKPFKCSECDKTFALNKYLVNHYRHNHKLAAQPLVCQLDDCNKQFKTETAFKHHQKFQHLLEKKFVCDHENCGYKSSTKDGLLIHMDKHNTDKPFKCPIDGCPKRFKYRLQISYHVKTHTTERNFRCTHEGCGKTFITSRALRDHVSHSHSKVFYSCDWPGCEYRHRRKESVSNHSAIHSNDRPFGCHWPQCDKRFKTRSNLREHLKIHKGDKPNVCHWPGCQYRCITPGNLKLHMKVHLKN